MSFAAKALMVLLSIAASAADRPVFRPKPIAELTDKVSVEKVTIAVEAFDEAGRIAEAFGKLQLQRFDVLPVYLVIANARDTPLDLKRFTVTYRPRGGSEIEAIPASEVRFLDGPSRPNMSPFPGRYPIPLPQRRKKGPLESQQFEERGFAAKMIAPGETAQGFVYFQTAYHGPVTITVSGMRDPVKNQDLFYIDVPLTHR